MRDEEEEVVYEEVKVECQQVSKDPVVAEVEQIFEDLHSFKDSCLKINLCLHFCFISDV